MKTTRKIRKVWKSKPTIEGAGVHLQRVFGYNHVPQLDPFLLLDDFRSNNPAHYLKGFPWHPIGVSKRLPMSFKATWSTETASGTAGSSVRATCSG